MTIDEMEAEAGRLLVAAGKARAERGDPDDAHEMRHLFAAVLAGNSSPCGNGADCVLDAALMRRLHDANRPGET